MYSFLNSNPPYARYTVKSLGYKFKKEETSRFLTELTLQWAD